MQQNELNRSMRRRRGLEKVGINNVEFQEFMRIEQMKWNIVFRPTAAARAVHAAVPPLMTERTHEII